MSMAFNMEAGILWDPREPPPPEYMPPFEAPFHPHVPPALQQPPINDSPVLFSQRNFLRPLSVSLVAQVVHDTANVSVTQQYRNDTDRTIPKGTYTFPLPAGCTVVDFSCRVGRNRIVRSRVKPKVEAREAFNDAARRNQTASLLEQDTPEIFTTTLANIPANTKLKAEISFIALLKHKFLDSSATTTLTIPTYIAARYNTPPELQHTQAASTSQDLSIRVEILAEGDIASIISKTHDVDVQIGAGRSNHQSWDDFVARGMAEDPRTALVRLVDGIPFLEKDFVLSITTLPHNGIEAPHAYVETHPSLENHKAVMLTIPPKFMLRNQSPMHDAEILFVADRSGSMDDKIESLKSAMSFFLKGIPQGQWFNIWCFGTSYTSLWLRSKKYSESALREALTYVSQQFKSDMGGTELLPALKAIVNARGGFHMTDVILLTDGQVWRLDETIDFIRQTRRTTEGRVRFFALGIGDAVSHELVEGIAKAGGGYAEVIPAASQGGWEDRLVAVLRAALTGHIGPLRIEFHEEADHEFRGGGAGQEAFGQYGSHAAREPVPTRRDNLQSPADISALSPFLRNRVFMLFDSMTSQASLDAVNIRATTPGGDEIVTRIPIEALRMKATTLHKLGARALLGDLERGQSRFHLGPQAPRRNSYEEQQLIRREGESLGIKWSLVSKWTSFYAIEEPYESQEDALDPFLDVDEPQIQHVTSNDLDLLRPRGHLGQQVLNPFGALPPTPGGQLDEQGEDDESASEPDSSDTEHTNNDNNDDREGGDGAWGGSLGGASPGQPPGPNENHDRRPPPGREIGEGASGPPYGSNAGTSRNRTHHESPNSVYRASYGNSRYFTPVRNTSYSGVSSVGSRHHTATFDVAHPTFAEPHKYQASSITSPNFGTSPLASSPDASHHYVVPTPLQLPKSDDVQTAPDRFSNSAPPSSTYYDASDWDWSIPPEPKVELPPVLPPFSPSRKSKTHKIGARFGLRASNMSSLPRSASKPVNNLRVPEISSNQLAQLPSAPQHTPKSMEGISELSSEFSTKVRSKLSAGDWDISSPPLKTSRTRPELSSDNTPQRISQPVDNKVDYFMGSRYGQKGGEIERVKIQLQSLLEFDMSTPIHNPPASMAMLPIEMSTPKSPQDMEKEALIRRLLPMQSFDGSFWLTVDDQKNFFGNEFCLAVQALGLQFIDTVTMPELAVTISILVILEERFQSCKDLWLLISQKAGSFVDIWLSDSTKEDMFKSAKELLQSKSQPRASAPSQSISTEAATTPPSSNTPTRRSWLSQKFHKNLHPNSEKATSLQNDPKVKTQRQSLIRDLGTRRSWLGQRSKKTNLEKPQLGIGSQIPDERQNRLRVGNSGEPSVPLVASSSGLPKSSISSVSTRPISLEQKSHESDRLGNILTV